MTKKRAIVLKFGGSATVDVEGLNLAYITRFLRELDVDLRQLFDKAVFVVGGGKRARQAFQSGGVQAAIEVTQEHALQLDGALCGFGYNCLGYVPTSPSQLEPAITQANFGVAVGGLEVGQTTDAVAMSAAEVLDSLGYQVTIIVLSNVAAIYTADPRTELTAKPIKYASLSWMIEQGILLDNPAQFSDGMSVPLDPVAVSRYSKLQQHQLLFCSADDVLSVRQLLMNEEVTNGTLLIPEVEPCFHLTVT